MSRRKFLCKFCNVDTGKLYEHYFVHTDLWLSVMPSINGMSCVGCFEDKLGRQLNKDDFPPVWINNPKYEPKSQRLLDRLNKVCIK